jgi:hypothetical protein
MHKETEQVIEAALEPIAKELGRLFIKSIILRINYRLVIAADAGAEPEDVPQILQTNIDECAETMRLMLEKISEVESAKAWNKAHGADSEA